MITTMIARVINKVYFSPVKIFEVYEGAPFTPPAPPASGDVLKIGADTLKIGADTLII